MCSFQIRKRKIPIADQQVVNLCACKHLSDDAIIQWAGCCLAGLSGLLQAFCFYGMIGNAFKMLPLLSAKEQKYTAACVS